MVFLVTVTLAMYMLSRSHGALLQHRSTVSRGPAVHWNVQEQTPTVQNSAQLRLPFNRRMEWVGSRGLHDSPLRPNDEAPRPCLLYL